MKKFMLLLLICSLFTTTLLAQKYDRDNKCYDLVITKEIVTTTKEKILICPGYTEVIVIKPAETTWETMDKQIRNGYWKIGQDKYGRPCKIWVKPKFRTIQGTCTTPAVTKTIEHPAVFERVTVEFGYSGEIEEVLISCPD